MSELLLIKLLHLLGFAYWLGGDVGVFYSSFYVANEKLDQTARVTTAKILFALDQLPRICMTMMLPLGVHLAWRLGIFRFDAWFMTLVWIAAFAWLAMVVYLHAGKGGGAKNLLTRFDFWFRLALSGSLVLYGLAGLLADTSTLPYWITAKLAIFGGLVGLGLIIRVRLKPFGPAFARLAAGQADDRDNAAIRASLAGTRPFVILIWTGLVVSAALGIHLL